MSQHADSARADKLIYIVVFLCGGILMALEILGSRILAPSFGDSIFVWGSLISIFLAALSLGYFLGGRLADRWPRLSAMALLVAASGLLIFVLPFIYPALNRTIARHSRVPGADPLLAGFLLFLLPSLGMGTVSPYAVRL